jgi:Ca2+-binding RTX toxin-like protein
VPDTTPPETTITSGPSGETTSTTATFHFTSSESSSTFECSMDGAAFEACSSPKSYTGLATGEHTFTVRATDAAGNTDSTPAQRTWSVTPDTTPPETTITSGPTGEVASTTATFQFVSSESPSSFECSLDGAAFEACSSPKTYTGLASGEHTFSVKATDAVGNTDPTPAQHSWNVLACTIVGTEGADRLTGTSGDDIVCTLGGNDEVAAGGGNDTVLGGSGDDKLFGGIGADTLRGGTGRDELSGDDGNDALFGEEGFDKLNGGAGNDSCEVGPDGGETANCE